METQSHNIKVELLQEKDMEWFAEVAATRMLIEEVGKPELVNEDAIYALTTMGILSDTAFIAKIGESPVGALGAIIVPNTYNPNIKTLVEMFWYVLPEYRKSRAGLLLLNAYAEKAEELGLEATMSLLPTSNIQDKTLAKRGFSICEYAYRKER